MSYYDGSVQTVQPHDPWVHHASPRGEEEEGESTASRVLAVLGAIVLLGLLAVMVLIVASIPDGPLRKIIDPAKVPRFPGRSRRPTVTEDDSADSPMYLTLQLLILFVVVVVVSSVIAYRKVIIVRLVNFWRALGFRPSEGGGGGGKGKLVLPEDEDGLAVAPALYEAEELMVRRISDLKIPRRRLRSIVTKMVHEDSVNYSAGEMNEDELVALRKILSVLAQTRPNYQFTFVRVTPEQIKAELDKVKALLQGEIDKGTGETTTVTERARHLTMLEDTLSSALLLKERYAEKVGDTLDEHAWLCGHLFVIFLMKGNAFQSLTVQEIWGLAKKASSRVALNLSS